MTPFPPWDTSGTLKKAKLVETCRKFNKCVVHTAFIQAEICVSKSVCCVGCYSISLVQEVKKNPQSWIELSLNPNAFFTDHSLYLSTKILVSSIKSFEKYCIYAFPPTPAVL